MDSLLCSWWFSVGTKLEMLAVEKAYLKGDFTPFKDDGSVEVSQSGSSKSSSTEELSPSSTAEALKVATSSKPKRRKRSTITIIISYWVELGSEILYNYYFSRHLSHL